PLLLCAVLLLAGCAGAQDHALQSPDGRISVVLELDGQGQLRYSISRDGAVVLRPSRMGLVLADRDLGRDLRTLQADAATSVEDAYTLAHGKQKEIAYRARDRVYRAETPEGQVLPPTLRVSGDGYHLHFRDDDTG